jgi:hypothetical protein
MIVRFFAVALGLGEDLTVADLFEQLEKSAGKEFQHRGHTRIMHTDKVGAYHVAVFLTVSDHKTLMKIRREGGRYTVKPDKIEDGSDMVDFNFLAVHKTTGRGLYQHYRGSLSIPFLTNVLSRQHVAMVNARRAEWIESQTGAATTLLKKSRNLHKGQLSLRNIVRMDDFGELVKRLDEVTAFQVDLLGISDQADEFQPLATHVKATRYRLTFKSKVSGETVASKIKSFVKKEKPHGGRVEGREDGLDTVFDIHEQPASIFATHDFDEVAKEFLPHEFAKAALLKELVRTCIENKSVLERPSE